MVPAKKYSPSSLVLGIGLLLVFAIALLLRWKIFSLEAVEGDERMYLALVGQLLRGESYSLHGNAVLLGLTSANYDSPVFFHPPFGIFLFSLFYRVGGILGIKFAQIFCFSLFFTSMLLCVRVLLPKISKTGFMLTAVIVAFTPIYANTNMKVWIDNPRVAFFALHFLLILLAAKSQKPYLWILASLTSFLPVLTKVDCLAAYPFAYWIAWEAGDSRFRKRNSYILLSLFAANFLVAVGWIFYSDALKYGPGKPAADLIKTNFVMWYVTVKLSSAQFLFEYLEIVGTLVGSVFTVVAAALLSKNRDRTRLALVFWIFSLCALYGGLGFFGYSKLHRFLAMTIPATCLLFASALNDFEILLQKFRTRRAVIVAAGILLGLGFSLEMAQGINELVYYPKFAVIFPVLQGVPE